jgi:putative SOS response-associated peptidase YedK
VAALVRDPRHNDGMCGRYTVAVDPQLLAERFNVALPEEVVPRFNVAPTDPVLALTERTAGRRLMFARWGLVPHWAKEPKVSARMINARAETLAEKPAYGPLLAKGRCLILADGFYEWRLDPDGTKRPVRYTLGDGSPFGFAGLWTGRRDPESDEWLRTCTIITTTANELVAPVHDRMPVILPREVEDAWLDRDVSIDEALALLQPYPAEDMSAADVSMLVNSVKNDDRRLLDPSQ